MKIEKNVNIMIMSKGKNLENNNENGEIIKNLKNSENRKIR